MAWTLIATAAIAHQMGGVPPAVRAVGANGALADELAAPISRTLRYGNLLVELSITLTGQLRKVSIRAY